MSITPTFDDDLVRRLPLPLAQLYRRAHNAKTPLERHLTAYFLWEAALKLLGSVAIVAYADQGQHDPEITERLRNLARPSLGHWREFVRLLLPKLAAEDAGFRQAADLLGRTRDDLPRAAGLDATLRDALDGQSGARSTVRLDELFDRLVRYRNRELGHGAAGQASEEVYERVGAHLLVGLAELLGRLDVLAGRRLLFVGEVRRQGSGDWVVERYELTGENPRRLPVLVLPSSASGALPHPERVYLSAPPRADGAVGEPGGPLRSLHPLVLFESETAEAFFLNARRGAQRGEYLCYASGRVADRRDAGSEQREFLAQVLGMTVDEAKVGEWAARSQSEEPPTEAREETNGSRPRRIGEFEIVSELGRGGMGVVYRAWQPSLGRQVALKTMLRSGDPKAEARFGREIRALGKVDHPHLVKIFASGSEGDRWFYAMELIDGITLGSLCEKLAGTTATAVGVAEWRQALTVAYEEERRKEVTIGDDGPEPRPRPPHPPAVAPRPTVELPQGHVVHVVEMMCQAADAAHALHEVGVVHRDIKPGNLLLTPDGAHVVLMDLGLAQLADEAQGKLTRTRQFVGTLRYASPEQVLAVGGLDRRTDIYSLGATLWEMLTLRPLYGVTDQTPSPEMMQRIQTQDPEPVRKYNPRVPRDLEAIVLKCLEKDPKRRYATAQELADDLRRFLKHEPVQARPIGPLQRVIRRARRRPAAAIALVLFAIAVPTLLGFGYWLWDTRYRLKVEYYATYAQRHESPIGIGRVSPEEAQHRARTWKFHLRGRQVDRIELVNGSGVCPSSGPLVGAEIARTDIPSRTCSLQFLRDDQGEVIQVIGRDRADNVDWTFHYSTPTAGFFADEDGIPRARGGTGAAHVKLSFTPDGLRNKLWYLDKEGKPQANADGVFAYEVEHDDRGLAVRTRLLGADRQPVRNKEGFAEYTSNYDDRGNLVVQSYFDEVGRPTRIKEGYAGWTLKYDEYGNATEGTYLDEAGRPTHVNAGEAHWTAKYDERGNRTEQAYFDDAGRPTLGTLGMARWTAAYDERGNMIELNYFDMTGRPARGKIGAARVAMSYDEHDNLIEVAFFDEAGRPTRHKDGTGIWSMQYDERGNMIKDAYFDVAKQPIRIKLGYASTTAKFNERGNKTEVVFYDLGGQRTRNKHGYARYTARFDERGNRTEVAYFDEHDRPTRSDEGIARSLATYDDRGNPIEEICFDEAGKRTRHKLGYARWTAEYDDRGDMTQQAFFDEANQPTYHKDGYALVQIEHDRNGNITKKTFLNPNGKAAWHKEGYTTWKANYDVRGNITEQAFFDEHNRPVLIGDGYAKVTMSTDERGRTVEVAYFDAAGGLTTGEDRYARRRFKYDERGNRVEIAYLDAEGRPARSNNGNARVNWTYDQRGNQLEEANFDETGKAARVTAGYSKATWKYNERDDKIEGIYLDEMSHPVQRVDGYAGWKSTYDDRGNEIAADYFDETGRPARLENGYSRITWSYDDRDRKVAQAYFDALGRPLRLKNGLAAMTLNFDDRGNRIEEAYFDELGRPTQPEYGPARATMKYDARNNEIEQAYFDGNGLPMRNSQGLAAWNGLYDDRDNLIKQTYLDEASHPVRHKQYGYASWTAKFDDRDKQIEEAYFDETGARATDRRGVARWIAQHNDRGQEVGRLLYDTAGKLLESRILVGDIDAGSQAERLGLKKGDVVLSYGGNEVHDRDEFIKQRSREPAGGKPQELIVLRDGKRVPFLVKPGLLGAGLANRLVPAPQDGAAAPPKSN